MNTFSGRARKRESHDLEGTGYPSTDLRRRIARVPTSASCGPSLRNTIRCSYHNVGVIGEKSLSPKSGRETAERMPLQTRKRLLRSIVRPQPSQLLYVKHA